MLVLPLRKQGLLLGLLIGVFCQEGRCQQQQLNASTIPDSLRKEAAAVKRSDETDIEIESPRKAKLRYKRVFTILNPSGDAYAAVYTFYDKFHKLNNATATLYDAGGRELKKIRKGDMEDWSAEGSGTLMTDTRIKFYRFIDHSYPYTIAYEEETDLDGLFILPQWLPQPAPALAVEDCRLVVKTPSTFAFLYKQYHCPEQAVVTDDNGIKTYTWEIRNRPATRPEPLAPSWLHLEPCVKMAPGSFEIQGYKGHMYTWTDMGDFINALWQGRDQLPEAAKKKVHALTDGLKDDHEKIDVLYDFLQKNSHYVSIQLGIGGWQPFDAAYVYNNRYGDCKALSNFMVALLKEAGVSASAVLIKAGSTDPDIDTGFACSQFNHAIVLAHAGNDSVWLECTSQTLIPGYLGSFTDDRDALLIDKTGGIIVHTPVYGLAENQLTRTVKGNIDSIGNLQAVMETRYTGLEQDALHNMISRSAKKDLSEQRRLGLGLNNCTITDLGYREYRDGKEKIPAIDETMRLNAGSYATMSGSRLFITPGTFLKSVTRLPETQQPRKNDIELMTSFQETDSVMLRIPQGYVPEKPLASRHYASSFGSYAFHSELKGDTLLIISHYQQNKGRYPAATYVKLAQFFTLIHRETTNEMVLVRNN
jgi:hypothetical protein